MKIPTIIFVCAFGLLAVGCADHLGRYYQAAATPVAGQVGTGATFVTKSGGMTVYHGQPPMPYYVIGRFDRPIGMNRIAGAARYYGADFIFIDEHVNNVTVTDPGLILFGNNAAVAMPGKSHAESRLGGIVYLGVTNLSHIHKGTP